MKRIGLCLAGAVLAGAVFAVESVDWRGAGRTGVYDETGLLKEWPEGGPALAWTAEGLGEGYSSLCVTADRIYTTGQGAGDQNGLEFLVALGKDGTILWKTEYGRVTNRDYKATRTTPVLDKAAGRLYVISGFGEIACVNAADGAIVWKVDAATVYKGSPGGWGFAESPLLVDGKVICTVGGSGGGAPSGNSRRRRGDRADPPPAQEDSPPPAPVDNEGATSVLAFNVADGSLAWKTEALGVNASFVSPMTIGRDGKAYIISTLANTIVGIDAADGTIAWQFNQRDKPEIGASGNHATTPLFKDNMFFTSSSYGEGAYAIRVNDAWDTAEFAWLNKALDIHHGGAVALGDVIYGIANKGDLMGLAWQSGEETGRLKVGKGAIVSADGMLYCYNEQGTVSLINPEGLEKVGELKITAGTQQHWAHPVISDKVLYVRHGNALQAFNVGK